MGTFAVTEQSATLDVANQLLLPPSYAIRFSSEADVPAHQLQTLAAGFDNDTDTAEAELARFGAALHQRLQQQAFTWQGVGALTMASAQVHFAPATPAPLMNPVAAQRVVRENVEHTVLVGDLEKRYTAEAYEASLAATRRRDWFLIVGWIIAILAFAFLVYHLYINNFAPEGSGLRSKPEIGAMPRQYRESSGQ